MDIARLIDDYLAGPQQLRAAVAGMTPDQLNARPIPGKWSTRQVICHLADFECVYADRLKRVLAEEQPTIFGGDPDLFAARLAYDHRDIRVELDLVEITRRHVAAILQTRAPADFQRIGHHREIGPITLEKLLSNIANHIPHHMRFIQQKRAAL